MEEIRNSFNEQYEIAQGVSENRRQWEIQCPVDRNFETSPRNNNIFFQNNSYNGKCLSEHFNSPPISQN